MMMELEVMVVVVFVLCWCFSKLKWEHSTDKSASVCYQPILHLEEKKNITTSEHSGNIPENLIPCHVNLCKGKKSGNHHLLATKLVCSARVNYPISNL